MTGLRPSEALGVYKGKPYPILSPVMLRKDALSLKSRRLYISLNCTVLSMVLLTVVIRFTVATSLQ